MRLTNSEIRAKSREVLGGKIFAQKWLMALLASLVVSIIVSVASSFTFGIGAIVLAGPLYLGINKLFLNTVRTSDEIKVERVFDGFKNFKSSFILSIMESIFIFLWSLLLIVPGIIKAYAYSMSIYILADHPEYTWKQCLAESQKMMKGHKWSLFCLQLSFIGWIIVSIFTLGLGMLWVAPYQQTANAVFYNELKAANEPEVEAEEVNA